MNLQTQIQFYAGATDNKGKPRLIEEIIPMLREEENLRVQVNRIRALTKNLETLKAEGAAEAVQKSEQITIDNLKKKLPAVTWSGTFSQRKAEKIKEYSGLICIDIDKLESEELYRRRMELRSDPYTFVMFISPSGKGLKVIVPVKGGVEKQLVNFLGLQQYYNDTYKIQIDQSGKDVSRLCFLSHDPEFYYDPLCEIFETEEVRADPPKQVKQYEAAQLQDFNNFENTLEEVKAFTDKLYQYTEGNRNNYIFIFSCNANRKGIDINDTLNFVTSFAGDLDMRDLAATIKSAYEHNKHEFGKYAKVARRPGTKKAGNNTAARQSSEHQLSDDDRSGPLGDNSPKKKINGKRIEFWKEFFNKKTEQKQISLYYTGLVDFLEYEGYYRLPLAKGYEFIRYQNNIAETVEPIHMQDFVVSWAKGEHEREVVEMLIKGCERYFSEKKLSNLPYKKLQFVEDSPNEAFYFFRNCYVRVTEVDITSHPISELAGTLWKKSVIDRDFTRHETQYSTDDDGFLDAKKMECEMARFVSLVSHNPNSKDKIDSEDSIKRFHSVCSSIGYMLHGYKPKNCRAIVAVDHKMPEDKSEQNGGTGKSILGESFRYLKSSTIIDGREFREDYPFRFELVGVDTKIVVMQDCKRTLDFGTFFNAITGDFTYNRRHTGYITMPFKDSPKWWFDTNFVFKGEGASFRRRMHVIELDDYFSDQYTPVDEFDHFLFNDWDNKQWNLFYNFYFECVQLYLKRGLIEYPKSNYSNRKLLEETPQDFIDFMEATNDDVGPNRGKRQHFPINREFKKLELFQEWNQHSKELNMTPATANAFTRWTKRYCSNKGFFFHIRKSSGKEFWTIADDAKHIGAQKEQTGNLFENTVNDLSQNDQKLPFPENKKSTE